MSLKNSLRVMVIDDMSVSRGLLSQALEDIGIWQIQVESSAVRAFSKLSQNAVHLVLCDYNMPEMNGLELLKKLRAGHSTRKIGFILVTGSVTKEIVEKGRSLMLNNIIKKPFTNESLKKSIETVVGRI